MRCVIKRLNLTYLLDSTGDVSACCINILRLNLEFGGNCVNFVLQ